MENSKKIKIKDLTNDQLKTEELTVITGGYALAAGLVDGCGSGVCINNRDVGAEFCAGSAVCTSGIGPCQEKTTL